MQGTGSFLAIQPGRVKDRFQSLTTDVVKDPEHAGCAVQMGQYCSPGPYSVERPEMTAQRGRKNKDGNEQG